MKKQLEILLVAFTFIGMVSPRVSAIGLGVDCLVEDENGNDIIEYRIGF